MLFISPDSTPRKWELCWIPSLIHTEAQTPHSNMVDAICPVRLVLLMFGICLEHNVNTAKNQTEKKLLNQEMLKQSNKIYGKYFFFEKYLKLKYKMLLNFRQNGNFEWINQTGVSCLFCKFYMNLLELLSFFFLTSESLKKQTF